MVSNSASQKGVDVAVDSAHPMTKENRFLFGLPVSSSLADLRVFFILHDICLCYKVHALALVLARNERVCRQWARHRCLDGVVLR